jgi:hypothetical protein
MFGVFLLKRDYHGPFASLAGLAVTTLFAVPAA